jgi:transposase
MERDWLERELAKGRSIESLARELDRPASTVAYWVHKHGLERTQATGHAARGAVARETLEQLLARGLSARAIARELGRSQASVRHWLARYGLTTTRPVVAADIREVERVCPEHGSTRFVRYSAVDTFRCEQCRRERVTARRRRVEETLAEEAGGRCALCGYDRYLGALQLHHLDAAGKSVGIAYARVARSPDRSRAEAATCVLLCGNCHAEVEAGIAELPCGTDNGRVAASGRPDAG